MAEGGERGNRDAKRPANTGKKATLVQMAPSQQQLGSCKAAILFLSCVSGQREFLLARLRSLQIFFLFQAQRYVADRGLQRGRRRTLSGFLRLIFTISLCSFDSGTSVLTCFILPLPPLCVLLCSCVWCVCIAFHFLSVCSNMTDIQDQRAFQKQQPVFLASKRLMRAKKVNPKEIRYYKNVGLGFQTPKEAIEGNYVDLKCPFTGDVSIRGRILRGIVKSTKMRRTVIIRRDYLHYIPKYNRYEKRHKNMPAHCSPAFRVSNGDQVIVGECRPLSKTVRFNVVKILTSGSTAKKTFSNF